MIMKTGHGSAFSGASFIFKNAPNCVIYHVQNYYKLMKPNDIEAVGKYLKDIYQVDTYQLIV